MEIASTMAPRDVAVAMIEHAVVKHRTRYDHVFFKVSPILASPLPLDTFVRFNNLRRRS